MAAVKVCLTAVKYGRNVAAWNSKQEFQLKLYMQAASHKSNPSSIPRGYAEIHTLGHVEGSNRWGGGNL